MELWRLRSGRDAINRSICKLDRRCGLSGVFFFFEIDEIRFKGETIYIYIFFNDICGVIFYSSCWKVSEGKESSAVVRNFKLKGRRARSFSRSVILLSLTKFSGPLKPTKVLVFELCDRSFDRDCGQSKVLSQIVDESGKG